MKPVDFPRFLLPLPLRTFRERRTDSHYCSTSIRFMQGKVRRLYAAILYYFLIKIKDFNQEIVLHTFGFFQ